MLDNTGGLELVVLSAFKVDTRVYLGSSNLVAPAQPWAAVNWGLATDRLGETAPLKEPAEKIVFGPHDASPRGPGGGRRRDARNTIWEAPLIVSS